MLGIDISEKRIRVVRLRRRGSGFALQPPLEVAIEGSQSDDPIALGRRLGQALRARGWSKQKAVMTLPDRLSFVRRLPTTILNQHPAKISGHLSKSAVENLLNLARQTMLVPADDLVMDLWTKPGVMTGHRGTERESDGVILLGATQKSVVEFCRELGAASNTKILSLELRSLAAVNGLLFNWHEAPEENIAIVYLSEHQADVAFLDSEGFFSLQTVNLPAGPPAGGHGAEEVVLEHLPRIFNTIKLSEPSCVPMKIYLGGGNRWTGSLASLAGRLKKKIGIEVALCRPEADLILQGPKEEISDLADFTPAIGAALDGLAASPTWFDFLHPRGRATDKKKPVSWKPFVFAAVASILLGCAFWLSLVQQKITERDSLKISLDQLQPELEKMAHAKGNWTRFRSYLPAGQGGGRLNFLHILYEISERMPGSKEAYLTSLTISGQRSITPATTSDILITGRVRKGDLIMGKVSALEASSGKSEPVTKIVEKDTPSDVSTGFIARLNDSKLFHKAEQAASLTLDTTDSLYPFSFSVTCNLLQLEKSPLE